MKIVRKNGLLSAARLNDRNVSIDNTPHKGQEVFANRDFLCEETVVIGLIARKETERTKYSVQVDWENHILMESPAVWINHSGDPSSVIMNNRFGAYDFVAFRDIHEGEELTFDYAATEYEIIAMKDCFCGEEICRKTPGGYTELPEDHQLKVRGLVGDYLHPARQVRSASAG